MRSKQPEQLMQLPNHREQLVEINRLHQLFGLIDKDIQDVVMQGLLARRACSPHHPRTFPGLAQWAETVRALRGKTAPLGWTYSDDNNFPLSIHPSENLVIVVQTGDVETGTAGIPSNRAPKGSNTEDAVAINMRQMQLFDTLPDFTLDTSNNKPIMWVLLYHVAPTEIRFELSLPLKMVGGKIRSWQERIVFPPIPLEQNDIEIGDDDGTDFDVPVERR
jgi:hypothetical protein